MEITVQDYPELIRQLVPVILLFSAFGTLLAFGLRDLCAWLWECFVCLLVALRLIRAGAV